jgi:type II secretory pathway component GspD/PulD (secretin)
VSRGKALLASLDVPRADEKYLQVYKIRTLDAASVAALLQTSIPDIQMIVEKDLNSLAVIATSLEHQRISAAVSQLEEPQTSTSGTPAPPGNASGNVRELVTLKSTVPLSSGNGDIIPTIVQALQTVAPDVHVFPLAVTGQLMLVGPSMSVRSAKEMIADFDVVPRQVVLDTEVLEVDETVAKNLGIQLGTAILSTTYSEATPAPNGLGATPSFDRLQAFGRTPLAFTAELNLLVQNGKGRVLADPRITTLSGRTASIKAGDNISILTTTAGSVGTIATTQVQSFQTGVTLDITPIIDDTDGVTVNLHPVVNSLIGLNNGIPEISTRDTQTTVRLRNNETLVIGGLIQENDTRTTTKIPVIGDLPLVGRLFRNDNVNNSRNELVIVITPHIVGETKDANYFGSKLKNTLQPNPLPTIIPGTMISAPPPPSSPQKSPQALRDRQNDSPSLQMVESTPQPKQTEIALNLDTHQAAASPAPTPSAFAQVNTFLFGAVPRTNYARSSDPVTFYYASLSPTVIKSGSKIDVAVITSSNAASVKLQIGNQAFELTKGAPGQWQTSLEFPKNSTISGQSYVSLSLTASRNDGATASISIPVNIDNDK